MLCIDNVVLIFNFLPAVKHRKLSKALLKNGFNKVQKNIQEMRLPKFHRITHKTMFWTFWLHKKYIHNLKIFQEYPWNDFETDIRGMFFEYSGNITLRLLEFAKRSIFVIIKSCTFHTKTTFSSKTFKKFFFFKMFPGCPDHCNAEGALSEYSRNIAYGLGSIFIQEQLFFGHLE